MNIYLTLKSLHLIAVISWMAGLLYLPRIFVYHEENKENLKYIYTGLQIINPEVFLNIKEKVFSINKIWDKLIKNNELFGMESNIDFLHVSTLDIYKNLNVK